MASFVQMASVSAHALEVKTKRVHFTQEKIRILHQHKQQMVIKTTIFSKTKPWWASSAPCQTLGRSPRPASGRTAASRAHAAAGGRWVPCRPRPHAVAVGGFGAACGHGRENRAHPVASTPCLAPEGTPRRSLATSRPTYKRGSLHGGTFRRARALLRRMKNVTAQ